MFVFLKKLNKLISNVIKKYVDISNFKGFIKLF